VTNDVFILVVGELLSEKSVTLVQELLRMLCTLRAGRYLLTHAPGSSRICIFAALPDDPDTEQVPFLPPSLSMPFLCRYGRFEQTMR
jgi:hypothetical protein